ncbi:hypothetical protein Cpir12675_003913 [Ceratocystis pirilliformis]|uniref:F-box domain-containing protein n=1 Tax=Ceratocystis pirilliformis TaxID=259994 RepID=A0ABR3Z0X1_9PEZI
MSAPKRPLSIAGRRGSGPSEDIAVTTANAAMNSRIEKLDAQPLLQQHHHRNLRGPPTPSMTSTGPGSFDQRQCQQQQNSVSPPPPPTPAASPGPSNARPHWGLSNLTSAGTSSGPNPPSTLNIDLFLAQTRDRFGRSSSHERTRIMAELLSLCTSPQLSFVYQFVTPLLKKDPFTSLPDELCLRILSFIDDPKTLARAAQVSLRWRNLLSDDMTWKILCYKHEYDRQIPIDSNDFVDCMDSADDSTSADSNSDTDILPSADPLSTSTSLTHSPRACNNPHRARSRKFRSYKSHFKQRYLVDAAWKNGGIHIRKHITQEGGVVTSLHLTDKYIILALDNASIHVFNTQGEQQKTLKGHVMGVWAMVPWGDILVSGGCDRDIRVWNLETGACIHTLRGHTSTVRCLKMSDANTAISGSRDTTLRVWNIATGTCTKSLLGHQASVRCLEIKGDIVVSGSYDTTARVWSISEGRCLATLQGHFSQIYAIAYDGKRVVTGSLDTNVRIWDPKTAQCLAILQGHTSLVGQIQLRGDTLVTGGSDGSVRVWSLERMSPIHRLAAHDNSVTSLQFDDTRVVSGGSDGRVKIWDLKTGHLVRELISQSDAVWRVAFQSERCVVLALRDSRTVMEVWSFSPPPDASPVDVLYNRPVSMPPCVAATALPMRTLSDTRRDERAKLRLPSLPAAGRQSTASGNVNEAMPSTAPAHSVTFFNED